MAWYDDVRHGMVWGEVAGQSHGHGLNGGRGMTMHGWDFGGMQREFPQNPKPASKLRFQVVYVGAW